MSDPVQITTRQNGWYLCDVYFDEYGDPRMYREPTPVAWLTDRDDVHFDKQDALRDCDGFITPLFVMPRCKEKNDNTK